MKIRKVHHTAGAVSQITVKLTKRDLAKVFFLMTTVTVVGSIPAGYVRRNLIDEAVQKLEDAAARNSVLNITRPRDEDA